jgi:hypothetical protein
MGVGVGRKLGVGVCGWSGRGGGATLHVEAVLDQGEAEAGPGPVLGCVAAVEQVGEQEADELEGHADHGVPGKGEEGADGEAVDVYIVAAVGVVGGVREGDGGFPVGGGGVGGGGFIGLWGKD